MMMLDDFGAFKEIDAVNHGHIDIQKNDCRPGFHSETSWPGRFSAWPISSKNQHHQQILRSAFARWVHHHDDTF